MPRHGLFLAGVFVLSLGCGSVSAEEPARLPAFHFGSEETQSATASEEPIPLHRDPNQRTATSDDTESSNGPSYGTILTALAVVLLLALGVAKLLGKSPSIGGAARQTSPVDVLHRQNIDGRNGLCIVRIGSRLLVMSSSATGLAPLSEITDPIEVESLTIELRAAREASDGALGLVTRWLDRSRSETETPTPSRPVSASDSVAGLTVREVEEGRRAG